MHGRIKRPVMLLITFLLLLCMMMSFTVSAAMPYDSYLYGENDDIYPATPAATPGDTFDGSAFNTTPLKGPQDLFCDTNGYLYIADTGNNRILKIDKNYSLVHEYKSFIKNGAEDGFDTPSGLYVDKDGNLLIADTGKQRLVKLNSNGEFICEYGIPTSTLLPSDFEYKPIKVTCDSAGRIFVASRGFNYGLLELDRNGEFVQMLGASEVPYTLSQVIWRFFSTKEQRDRMEAFVPAEYNNISIDSEDFIFATTGTAAETADKSTPVRKINAKGADILKREGKPVGDLETTQIGSIKGQSMIVDVANLDNGIYAILDQRRGRVFVYNQNGNLLFMFGGLGQVYGTLDSPSSLVFYNDNFLILDSGKNAIITYTLTDYGRLFFEAEKYKEEDNFEAEKKTWESILSLNENNPLVLTEMGKIYYKQRDMKSALKCFEMANDKVNYSRAYQFYRREVINEHFNALGLCALAVIALCIAFHYFKKYYWNIKHPRKEKSSPLKYSTYVIFHPFDGFWDLKREKRGSMKVAISIMGLACISMVFKTQVQGFIFRTKLPEEANFLIDIATVLIPMLLWIISTRCVTSLMDGEGSLKDIIISTGYSMTPIVLIIPLFSLLSNLLIIEEGSIFYLFVALAYIWTVFLLILSVKQTQNYSMSKTIGVVLISLLVVIIIVFIVLLCTALVQQMVAFFADLCNELVGRAQ